MFLGPLTGLLDSLVKESRRTVAPAAARDGETSQQQQQQQQEHNATEDGACCSGGGEAAASTSAASTSAVAPEDGGGCTCRCVVFFSKGLCVCAVGVCVCVATGLTPQAPSHTVNATDFPNDKQHNSLLDGVGRLGGRALGRAPRMSAWGCFFGLRGKYVANSEPTSPALRPH